MKNFTIIVEVSQPHGNIGSIRDLFEDMLKEKRGKDGRLSESAYVIIPRVYEVSQSNYSKVLPIIEERHWDMRFYNMCPWCKTNEATCLAAVPEDESRSEMVCDECYEKWWKEELERRKYDVLKELVVEEIDKAMKLRGYGFLPHDRGGDLHKGRLVSWILSVIKQQGKSSNGDVTLLANMAVETVENLGKMGGITLVDLTTDL